MVQSWECSKEVSNLVRIHSTWNDSITEGFHGPDDEEVRPPPPVNAHADSRKTIVDFPEEVEKRAKAKSMREAKVTKKNQVEQTNVPLPQQDEQDKKDLAFAQKERKARNFVSAWAYRQKFHIRWECHQELHELETQINHRVLLPRLWRESCYHKRELLLQSRK